MDIGIGLPNTLTLAGTTMVDWARRAEERGFSALSTIDRIVYPSYDSLTSLAVAAGATSRIGLFTDILIAPVYHPVWLAMAAPMIEKVRGAWQEAGREGEPRIAALVYFGLADDEASRAVLRKYYRYLGEWVDAIVESAVRTPQAARDIAKDFAGVGVTELVFDPTIGTLDQVDRLADAV